MYNPYNKDVNYNYATKFSTPLYGNIDPSMWYGATQPVTFFRSFFSETPDRERSEIKRTGILPSVTLEDINNMANWSSTPPTKDDMDAYMRLAYVGQEGYSGLIGRDVNTAARTRATLGYGFDPYLKIVKPLLENLSPKEVQKQSKNNPLYDYLLSQTPSANQDPETGEYYYVDANGKRVAASTPLARPAIKIGDQYLSNKDPRWKELTEANIREGTWYRFQKSLEAEGSIPSLALAIGAGVTATKVNTAFGVAMPGSLSKMAKELLGDVSLAAYDNLLNPFSSAGLDDDIKTYLKPTEIERIQGFDSNKWWTENIKPEVAPFLIQRGITPDFIAPAKGSKEALAKIQLALSESVIQQRMGRYSTEHPWESGILSTLVASLETSLINDPDIAVSLGVGMVAKTGYLVTRQLVAAGIKSLAPATKLALAVKASKMRHVTTAAKGVFQLSMGDLPLWFKNYSYLKKVGIGSGIAGAVNAGANIRDQLNRISFASTVLSNNNQDEWRLSEIAYSAFAGMLFGGALGSIGHLAHPNIGGNRYTARPDLRTGALRFINDVTGAEKSMLNETPQQRATINEGLAASRDAMAVTEANRPTDILSATGEDIKPNSIEVVDQRGNRIRVQEEDISSIPDVAEKILSGEYKVVRDLRTKADVAIRSDLNPIVEKPRIVSDEAALNLPEKHLVDTERVADAADTARRASDGTLAEATHSTAIDRIPGESNLSFATRLVRAKGVRSLSDVFKIVEDKSHLQKSMAGKLVQFKRQVIAIKETLGEVLRQGEISKEQFDEITALLPKLDTFIENDIDVRLRKSFESGSAGFKKLPANKQKEMIDFVMEHAGKSDEQISNILKASGKKFSRSEKNMIARRLKESKTKSQVRKLMDEMLSDQSISTESRKILHTLLGTPENLSLIQRRRASGAFRKEKYFLNKASTSTLSFYYGVLDIFTDALNLVSPASRLAARDNAAMILGLVRGALVNLNLPRQDGVTINIKLGKLGESSPGNHKLINKYLEITINSDMLVKALETGDSTVITHTILHELGHAYSYFATPDLILKMIAMYSEFLDPSILQAFVNITEASRGRTGVGMYAAINPGEVFANHFANKGLSAGLDAAAKLRLSFLEAFTTYVGEIIRSIADAFPSNSITKLKLNSISKVLNGVIEDISKANTNDSGRLIDFVREEREFVGALVKTSFYNTNRKIYRQNLINKLYEYYTEIQSQLGTPLSKKKFTEWVGQTETSIYVKKHEPALVEAVKRLVRDEMPAYADNYLFDSSIEGAEVRNTLGMLLSPENILSIQLFQGQRDLTYTEVKNILETAELASTRVALNRFLLRNKMEVLPSIEALNEFIKTDGKYISSGLNRYFSGTLFMVDKITDNILRLEDLNSKAKSKYVLRRNLFRHKGQSYEIRVSRPKFDHGLDDTSLVFYHSGTWDGEDSPNMLHAGTLSAALLRGAAKLFPPETKVVAFEISKKSNIIDMIDTGESHIDFDSYWKSICSFYKDKEYQYGISIEDMIRDIVIDKKKANQIMEGINNEEDVLLKTSDPPSPTDIKKYLQDAGIDIIRYKNSGEDEGSTSFVIVNPNIITVKAVGQSASDGRWVWRSKDSGDILETATRDQFAINYRGSASLQNLVQVVPSLAELANDFSEAIGVPKEVEFTPTSIAEVNPETRPKLETELNNFLVKINGLDKSFFKRLAGAVRAATGAKISVDDATTVLTDIYIASIKELDKKQIPEILTITSENSMFKLATEFKKRIVKKEYFKQNRGGKITKIDVFEDVKAMGGLANRNNESIDDAAIDIDAQRKRLSDFSNWVDTRVGEIGQENASDVLRLMSIRLQNSKLTKGTEAGKIPKLPAGSGEMLFMSKFPLEQADYYTTVQTRDSLTEQGLPIPEDIQIKLDGFKRKFDSLQTRIQKLEKKLLSEYRQVKDKPIAAEKVLYDAVLEKVAKSEDTALETQLTKAESIERDMAQSSDNRAAFTSKEETPDIAAPVLRGVGDKESFISSDWDGNPDTLELGGIFTNQRRAAGVRKQTNASHTTRVEINKSKVLRVVSFGSSAYESIKNLSDPILRHAGINKAIMERILGVVTKEHSEQEAFRVILYKLNEEGYTAVEFVDKNGGILGYSPTSKDHIKVLDVIDHSATKPVGYVSQTKAQRKEVVSPTPEPESLIVDPDPIIDPTESVVPISKTGEPDIETAQITKGESDIPVISPEEKFVHEVLNASETLRWNGTTPKLIRLALIKFMSSAKELRENLGVELKGIPDEFRGLLYKIVRVAEEIAEENRTRFADFYETLNDEFWTMFDREVAKELLHRSKPGKDLSVRSFDDILTFAHSKINENIALRNKRDGLSLPEFLKPISPDDFEFTSSKITNKMPDDVRFKKDSLAESMHYRIEKRLDDASKVARDLIEQPPETRELEDEEVSKLVIDRVNGNPKDNTMLLRESNHVSLILGGSQRESRSWWRKVLNGLVNLIEVRSQTAYTTRSLSNIVRTISAFADNSKAHIHNLVAGGKNAIKSWEQSSHETWRMLSGIRIAATTLAQSLGNEKLYSLISIEIMKSFATKTPLDPAKLEAIIRGVIPSPSAEYLSSNILNTNQLHNSVAEVNKNILSLEAETGYIQKGVSLVDKNGKAIKPTEYYPITFVGELVTKANEGHIIQEMVRVRTATLNASDKLDSTLMLAIGWFYNKEGFVLDRGRKLEGRQQFFLNDANFDKQTLVNLEERRYPPGTDPKNMIEFRGEASDRHFTYKDPITKELVVCRLPREKADLAAVDLAKYNETVNGSSAHLGKQWKSHFNVSKTVVELMMQDLLHSKLYRGNYSRDLATRRGNATTPMLALTDNARLEHGSVIPALDWNEILASDTLVKILRHDPLEAYTNFVTSRGFELLVQKEIDRLLGIKGIRISKFLTILHREARRLAHDAGGEKAASDVDGGFDRLAGDYLSYQHRLAMIQSRGERLTSEVVEISLGVVRGLSGTMWGITGSAEPLQHLLMSPFTVGPIQAVKNLWETVRILVGDKRFLTSAALRDELVESVFFMDLVRADIHDRILNMDGDGIPKMSRWWDRIKATREEASALGSVSDVFGNVMVEFGSSRYTTFLSRKLAMQRYSTRFAKFINNGAAERFFTVLNDPSVQARMKALEEAGATDIQAVKQLDKIFKDISRQEGFGGRWDIAMAMNKYGLNTVEKIRALKKMFDKLGPQYSKSGLINWKELRALLDVESKSPTIKDLDPKLAREAYESFLFATETTVTTEGAISTGRGLNRDLRIESRTPTGRIFKTLLGWSQSFFNNVLGNHGGMKESVLIGSMIMYTGLTAASEYIREWIRGRDWDDVKEEMRQNPETFLFRMMMNLPALGFLTGNLQYVLAKTSELTGGPLKAFRSPLMAPAYSMAVQQPYKMAGSLYDLVTDSIPSGDVGKIMSDIGDITMVNNLFNNSLLAAPARLLVELKAITDADALGRYMKLIGRQKNFYKKGVRYTGPSFVEDPEARKRLVGEIQRGRFKTK